jgi:hypothetical protein
MHAATNTAPKADGRVVPWNKGKLIGQKPPLKLKEIWAIRIRLQLDHRARELALFNLAIDSKLRGCDLVGLHVRDVFQGSHVAPRAIVMQKKTQRPVQFEITNHGCETCRLMANRSNRHRTNPRMSEALKARHSDWGRCANSPLGSSIRGWMR